MDRTHELHDFLLSVTQEMRAEYDRIFRRSKEDPGTAGDEGESNWSRLFSDWLPADIHVATKGRILAADGTASPQVDVVLLAGDYPRKLRDKKLYLAGGVLAAFECKNTLRKSHLAKFFANARKISELEPPKKGSFYGEGISPIVYGLLAHSHEWSQGRALGIIDAEIRRLHRSAEHPRHLPCLLSVSDLQTWELTYEPFSPMAAAHEVWRKSLEQLGLDHFACSAFMRWAPLDEDYAPGEGPQVSKERPNPIGELILYLLRHLANKEFDRSGMAGYYQRAGLSGGVMNIDGKCWDPSKIYSETLQALLRESESEMRKNRGPGTISGPWLP